MNRALYVVAALPLVAALVQACSSDAQNGVVAPTAFMPGTDGGSGAEIDAAMDAGLGTGPIFDAGMSNEKDAGVVQTTPGTRLVEAKSITILGATSDGFVLYVNASSPTDGGATRSLEVIGATGAATVIAAAYTDADDVRIDGKAIAHWTNVNTATGIAAGLSVWTAAAGLNAVATATAPVDRVFAVSEDGTRIVFAQKTAAGTLDLTLGKSDGSVVKVITKADDAAACPVSVRFVKATALTESCTGGVTATLRGADSTSADPTIITIGTDAVPGAFGNARNANIVSWVKATNHVGVVSRTDGTGTDSTIAQNVGAMFLNSDGSKVLVLGVTGGLSAATTADNPMLTALTPARNVFAISPDFELAVVNLKPIDATTNPNVLRVDINVASTTTPGTPTALGVGSTVGFSSTSSHLFYMTDLPTTGPVFIGTLKAHAAAGGTDKEIARGVTLPELVGGTSKVAFLAGRQALGQIQLFDISVGDASGTSAAATLVKGATSVFKVRAGNLFYASPGNGLYVVPVP